MFEPDQVEEQFAFLMRNSFMFFVQWAFAELNPGTALVLNPHLFIMAAKLEECYRGKCKRLMICLPPRSLKSLMVSVAFPAWVLGLDPNKQFINISYGQQLSDKHARDTLRLMTSPAYQKVFGTRISAKHYRRTLSRSIPIDDLGKLPGNTGLSGCISRKLWIRRIDGGGRSLDRTALPAALPC